MTDRAQSNVTKQAQDSALAEASTAELAAELASRGAKVTTLAEGRAPRSRSAGRRVGARDPGAPSEGGEGAP